MSHRTTYRPTSKVFHLQLAQAPTPLQRAMDKLRARLGDNEFYLWACTLGDRVISNRTAYLEAIERKLAELGEDASEQARRNLGETDDERPLPFDKQSDYAPIERED